MSALSPLHGADDPKVDHRASADEVERLFESISELMKRANAEAGPDFSRRGHGSGIIIERQGMSDGSHPVVVVYPLYRVAGQGRCLCEAMGDMLVAFAAQLENVIESKSWTAIPTPDRRLTSYGRILWSGVLLRLAVMLDNLFPVADDLSSIKDFNRQLTLQGV